jgi:hypothetical protein
MVPLGAGETAREQGLSVDGRGRSGAIRSRSLGLAARRLQGPAEQVQKNRRLRDEIGGFHGHVNISSISSGIRIALHGRDPRGPDGVFTHTEVGELRRVIGEIWERAVA